MIQTLLLQRARGNAPVSNRLQLKGLIPISETKQGNTVHSGTRRINAFLQQTASLSPLFAENKRTNAGETVPEGAHAV